MEVIITRKKTIIIFCVILVVLLILSVSGQIYKYVLYDGMDRYLIRMFNFDEEFNFPTFFAFFLLLICSFLLILISEIKKKLKDRFQLSWLLLGIIFFLFALDEIMVLHEQSISVMREIFQAKGIFFFAWTIPAMFLLVVFLAIYWKFIFHLSPKHRKLFFISGLIYVSGALGIELIGGAYASEHGTNTLTYALIANFEETLEKIGLIFFLYTLLTYIKDYANDIKLKVI